MKLLDLAAQSLFDKKAFNILALDVRGISTLTDYFLIATGTSDRHVIALADTVMDHLKRAGEKPIHVEGARDGDWVVLDFGDIILHLFQEQIREKYCLEELWHEAKVVDLNINVAKGVVGE